MTDYAKVTDFANKDTLDSGNANKIIKGAEIDAEFNAIAVASATKANSANANLTGTTVIATADINGGAIDAVTIGATTPATSASVDNININGNTISSTDTDGNIAITPNGTGEVDISKVDIDGGAIDGTVIGANSAAAVTGTTITASTQFTGSGAGLTSIPSGQLTGALPAIDGSALTSVSAPFTFVSQDMSGLYEKEFTGLPSGITEIVVFASDLAYGGDSEPRVVLGYGSTTYKTSEYLALLNGVNNTFERPNIVTTTDGFAMGRAVDTNDFFTATLRLYKTSGNIFHADGHFIGYEKTGSEANSTDMTIGTVTGMTDLANTLTAVKVDRDGGNTTTYTSGTITIAYR